MFRKGEKSYSVIKGKCPRCHDGDFFEFPFTFHPKKITRLHNNCPNCDLKYMIEPSFFYGAMYVNYGITVGLSIITFLLAKLVLLLTLLQSFGVIFIVLLLLAPLNLRLSRILWINMFVKFDDSFKVK